MTLALERGLSCVSMTGGLLYKPIDILTDALKVLIYFIVGNADYRHAKLFQLRGPLCVVSYAGSIIVLGAIQSITKCAAAQ